MRKLIVTLALGAFAALTLVACGSSSSTSTTAATTSSTSTKAGGGGAAQSVAVSAVSGSALAFQQKTLSAKAGNVSFSGTSRLTTIGPDGTQTTVNDLAGSGTVYFRSGLNWTSTGAGQSVRAAAENPPSYTSARISTMIAISGTTSLGYTTSGSGTEYADLAFTLSPPGSSPPPPSSGGSPGFSASVSGIRNTSGNNVASSPITVAGANTMLVAVVGEYGSTISSVATSLATVSISGRSAR